jgi:hypothetical protein
MIERPAEGPAFDELPTLSDGGEHYAWAVWGAGDQLGTINRLTREASVRGVMAVQTGDVVSLSLPLDEPAPGLFEGRGAFQRTEVRTDIGREDTISNLDLQFSSQWDGLRHIRHRTAGYYGGRDEAALDAGALGIDGIARRGIVSRGVLVDVPAYFAAVGESYAADDRFAITPDLLDTILEFQGVRLEYGDVLIVRTGWIEWYLSRGQGARAAMYGGVHDGVDGVSCPGLIGSVDMARWLWNSGIAAVAVDNAAVEALPVARADGFLHRRVLPLLGMPFGELWWLKELSGLCLRRGRYAFLLTSAPLNIPAGVASPANALAVL